MTEQARLFLDQALKLSVNERAVLAAELAASLDGGDEEEDEATWLAEIERRIRRVHSGESTGSDWDTVQARIEEHLRHSRA